MIKVTLGAEAPKTEKPFPKLMIASKDVNANKGLIVLFQSEGCGVVVCETKFSTKKIGYYSEYFAMEKFTDYNEPITIQNA